eukprot:7200890-Prymnesium_polylepis.2
MRGCSTIRPAPPRDLCMQRSHNRVQFNWNLPEHFGGCALSHFEVQLHELKLSAKVQKRKWVLVTQDASTSFTHPRHLYGGEVRTALRMQIESAPHHATRTHH